MSQMPRREFYAHLAAAMPVVRRIAVRLTRSRERADDLVQTVMLRALEKRHQFNAGTNFLGWLSTICFSQFANEYRKGARLVVADPDALINLMTTQHTAPARIELKETLAQLGRMPAETRRAILLRADGLRYEEIAEAMAFTEGTIKSRLSRGRADLRERCA